MKRFISLLIIYMFNLLPIRRNKLFLFSYYGSQYGCNPKYITNYILENYPDTFDIVWAFNDLTSRNDLQNIRGVKTMSLKYFYELCTSKVIITNYRTTDLFVKRKGQFYIQTWHSSLRLKQIEKDAQDTLPAHYVKMAIEDSSKIDLLLSGCQYSTDIFKRSFWYDGEIFEHGTPRNDLYFQRNVDKREAILKTLTIPATARILLYAPTFRNKDSTPIYNIDFMKLRETLQTRFGGEWMVLIRLHPHLRTKENQMTYGKNMVNVTDYDDVQELLLIADILISDYSSLMFDFSITGRPCFLYIPDVKAYTSSERELYFNMMELPFISALTHDDLFDKIKQFNAEVYKENLNKFSHKIGSYEEGKASEYLLNRISDICFNDGKGGMNEAV